MGGSKVSSSVKMRGSGADSSVTVGSPELTVGRVWLALWPAANPGALPECFAFRLAAVSQPWVAMNGLNRLNIKHFFPKMILSGAAKTVEW